jgi:hypothetical protein
MNVKIYALAIFLNLCIDIFISCVIKYEYYIKIVLRTYKSLLVKIL